MGSLRHRRTGIIAAVCIALLLLTACGEDPVVTLESDVTGTADDPTPSAEAAEPASGGGVGATVVTVWFARHHPSGIWLEPETHHVDAPPAQAVRAAMEAVVHGQSRNPELATLVPTGTQINDVHVEDGLATIDLSGDVARASGGSAQEQTFAQQLAHTATAFETVDAVRLLVDGQQIDELWGHLDWSEPITADPQLIAPIVIASPAWAAVQRPGPVTASGTSVTYESTVELRLIDPTGNVVEESFTTAAQPGVAQRGPWAHTFDTEATTPGTWTIQAGEPDPSGGEGRPAFTTSVAFEVS